VQPPPRASAIWRTALVVLVVFTVLGLLFSSQVWVDYGYSGHRLSWTSALTLALGQWYLWALLTPAIVWLARTFPIERRRLGRSFAVHVSAGLVCAVSVLVAQAALARVVTGIERGPFTLLQAHVNVLTYWAVVGVTHAVQNVESADLMLTRLSDLLRATLATSDVAELPLHRELALLAPYLDIQRARIGSRLTLTLEIEPQATDVLVPTLMLQPLVENAIKHGIADRSGPGTIAIAAKLVGAVLEITVCDDGPGPATKWTAGGHGLDNVRRRLAALHGDAASFSLDRLESGGAIARVRLPSRRASS
jgi:two-component system, LytTR family, sensor kinase